MTSAEFERIPDDADEIVLARRVWPDGRTRAYVCGRSATLADLQELGGRLLSFYGQHEHRKLMLGAAQLEILDARCGEQQAALRSDVGSLYERVRALTERKAELGAAAGARDRELDLLRFELDEIEAVDPSEEEQSGLTSERERLRHVEMLREAAAAGAEAIAADGGSGAAELLATAAAQLEHAATIDPALAPLSERLLALRFEAEDLGGRAPRLRSKGSRRRRAASRRSRSASRCSPAQAKARRHDRRGARPRGPLPRAA